MSGHTVDIAEYSERRTAAFAFVADTAVPVVHIAGTAEDSVYTAAAHYVGIR